MADSGALLPKPTDVFVSPLNRIQPIDVDASIKVIDAWLVNISGGLVNAERLKMVASGIPILANIFAAVDVVLDIKAMIEHGSKPVDVFDWTNLGLDLIGVVPLPPGTAEIRVAARPLLKIIRQEVAKSGKAVLESSAYMLRDAVIGAIATSLNERFAGEIENFIKHLKAGLSDLLHKCAEYIGKLMTAFADLFAQAAGEKGFEVDGNLRAAERHAKDIKAGFTSYDAKKVFHGAGQFIVDFAKIEVKGVANVATKTAKFIDPAASKDLLKISNELRAKIPATMKYVRSLDGNEIGKIGWLIEVGEQGVMRWRQVNPKKHMTGIPSRGQARVVAQRPQARNEVMNHSAPAEHPGAGECKRGCPVPTTPERSVGSIGFAFGDERIEHDDFVLDGPLSITWQRTYRSFFDAYDDRGELGARWITPYTSRFDIHATKLVYHGADGRSLDYPLLAPGEAKDDLAESLTLLRVDDQWLTLTRGPELVEVYERHGDRFRLAFVKDLTGNQLTLDYDAPGRLSRIIAPHALVAFRHDAHGRIVEIVHHDADGVRLGTLATYTYDREGDLVAAADRYGNTRSYRYANHLVTYYTDRTGRGMHLEWDGSGPKAKCIRERADDGSHAVSLAWHPDFRMVSVTDALGNVSRHYYDIKGYTFRVIHPDGSEEWLYRDEHDNLTQYIHRDGSVEHMRYDARGNLVEHVRADGSTIAMTYDDDTRLVGVTDPHGHVWKQEHDAAGQVAARIDPHGHRTEYSYDGQGNVTAIEDAKGGVVSLTYDAAGRLTSRTDCSGKSTALTYDADGRLASEQDASGAVTTFAYGENGRPIEIRTPAGIERVSYDAEGRLLAHVDPLNNETRFDYDAAGRIVRRTDPLGHATTYRYDGLGHVTAVVNAQSATYGFEYDALGRIVRETGFDGRTIRYTYGETDGLLQSIDDAGQVVTLEHDRAGRPNARAAGDDYERFVFDASGRWIDATNRHSRVQRFFDPVGNLVREHHAYTLFGEARSYVWHHEYDELGNRVRTIRPDGHSIDWLTYGSGHVHGMLLDGKEHLQFERDDLHRETERTLSSRVSQFTAFDPAGRLARRSVQRNQAPAPFAARSYRYDAAGQAIEIEDSLKGIIGYRYDPAGRLVESSGPAGLERFAFDAAGNFANPNRSATPRPSPGASPVRPDNTLPANVPRALGNLLTEYAGTRFTYDPRGNLVHARAPSGERHYEWDAFGRLTAARISTQNRQSHARYYYDALGRRIAKEVDGERIIFGWEGDQLAYETDGNRSTHYVYEPGTSVPVVQFLSGSRIGMPTPTHDDTNRYAPESDALQCRPRRESDASVFYYHCDQIGTPLMLTDEAGEVVWEASYRAWGHAQEVIARASRAAGATPRNPLRFQGQQFDDETGLHYNRLRYYDPQLGRFISEDPIALHGGVNTYQYAPNPVAYIDPLGLARGKCVIYWYNHIGGPTGHYTVKTLSGTGNVHTEQEINGDKTWIVRVSSLAPGEPVNSATFDIPDVGAAQKFQRDKIRAGSAKVTDGAYDVSNNSCMTHVMDVLNAGGADVPTKGKRAWAFLNRHGVGPRVR
ncbi:RHS repeat-associated core domain-containing protein [Burkholderia contaminans]|uniref:RHS repeat-associated core domain-containing protein n=1 Tax=Burkholderia contaminans TaxID=488447 RepID=UPI001CF1139F|nr:RHS repeat-associated core domain-containing protein [Burkholderia contaminans]MCA8101407.1 RHS domain-containing protein [Burkholderia contaminans]